MGIWSLRDAQHLKSGIDFRDRDSPHCFALRSKAVGANAMKTTLEIIDDLRADTADLAGKILLLSRRKVLSSDQRSAIDNAFKSLRFVTCHHFGLLRQAYGDEKWRKLGDIDIPDILRKDKEVKPDPVPVPIKLDLDEIVTNAMKLHQKMLELPGRDGSDNGPCDSFAERNCGGDGQSKTIEYLLIGFDFWRGVELALMTKELSPSAFLGKQDEGVNIQ